MIEKKCQCDACIESFTKNGTLHWSSCAVHNEPAMPVGECDCAPLFKVKKLILEPNKKD